MNSSIESLEIRVMDIAELNEAAQFHKEYYGDLRPPEIWHWEYTGINPEKTVLVLVRDKGTMVGTLGVIPLILNIAGESYLTGKVEGVLLSRDYRGTTLFFDYFDFAIKECRRKEIACLWGFTRLVDVFRKVGFYNFPNATKLAVLPVSFKDTIEQAQRQIENKMPLKKVIMKAGIWFSVRYAALRRFLKLRLDSQKSDSYNIVDTMQQPDDIEKMFTEIRSEYPDLIHIQIDNEYLNWRICNIPVNEHLTYFVYDGDTLVSYLIATIREKSAEIIDFMFIDKKAGVLAFNKALRALIDMHKGLITYSGNRYNPLNIKIFDLLATYGFLSRDMKNDFGFNNITFPHEEKLRNIKNWYVTDLWSEGV